MWDDLLRPIWLNDPSRICPGAVLLDATSYDLPLGLFGSALFYLA